MFFAQLSSAVGFSLIFPFLPLYVKQLGANTDQSVEFWAGMVISAQALTMALTAPVWGALADRYGRKLMVQRATFGGAVILSLMGYVTSAEQLVLLRAIQGMITGTVPAANALVASVTPRRHVGFAMGALQMGLWSGVAVGPMIGGFLADRFGYASTFLITGGLLALAGVMVSLGVKEKFAPATAVAGRRVGMVSKWRHVFVTPGVGVTFTARFLSGLSRAMLAPITPLFVAVLVADEASLNTTTGFVIGIASASATFSALYLGRLGDRIGQRTVFIASVLGAALFQLPQSLVTDTWQLLILQALAGVSDGGIVASLSALLARYTEPGEEGAVYGLDNSIVAGARAVAPMIGSAVAVWIGLRGAFVVAGVIMLGTALLSIGLLPKTVSTEPTLRAESPVVQSLVAPITAKGERGIRDHN